jgi:hypothetical protein
VKFFVTDNITTPVSGEFNVEMTNAHLPTVLAQTVYRVDPIANSTYTLTLVGDDKDAGDTAALVFALDGDTRTPFGTLTPEAADARASRYIFTPNASFKDDAIVSLYYRASDRCGATSEAGRMVLLPKQPPSITVTRFATAINTDLVERIHARNETYLEGLTFALKTPPTQGQLLNGLDAKTGQFTYRPKTNEVGTDRFIVSITDGAFTVEAEIQIQVGGLIALDMPRPNTAKYSLMVGEQKTILLPDPQLPPLNTTRKNWKYNVVTQPKLGVISSDDGHGTVMYKPKPGQGGDDTFQYQIEVGGQKSNIATVAIQVLPVKGPSVSDVALTCRQPQDKPQSCPIQFYAPTAESYEIEQKSKPENENRTQHGTLTPIEGQLGGYYYLPDKGFLGQDSFTVIARDSQGNESKATATIKVEIIPRDGGGDPEPAPEPKDGGGGAFDVITYLFIACAYVGLAIKRRGLKWVLG